MTPVVDFVRDGWVAVDGALDPEWCEARVRDGLVRMGVDEQDRTTWPSGWHNTAPTAAPPLGEIAPLAASVLADLVGGEERIAFAGLPDNLIFNFPSPAEAWWPPERFDHESAGWHKDGDWFRHYLDSPEQGILGIVFWRDVTERQGPTYVAADSIEVVARYLHEHPEGVGPGELPHRDLIGRCHDFRALTGRQGTVVLAHPFLVHSASSNATDRIRVISNLAVMLTEPLRFDRDDGAYSAVERCVLERLGVERLPFAASGPRERIVPERERRWREETRQP